MPTPDDAAEIRDFGALRAKDGQLVEPSRTPRVMIDPLSTVRRAGDPFVDVFCAGQVFFDIVFTGLEQMPAPGTEEWAPGMGSSPGGLANMAVAMRRLGLRTWLAAAFGDDLYGDYCWDTLANQEDIDLSASRRFDGWHSPVTVSFAAGRDRTMVTHGHQPPQTLDQIIGSPPPVRACFVALALEEQKWVSHARASGAMVFADLGWDTTQQWSAQMLTKLAACDVFLPNEHEAMTLSRSDDPLEAASFLAEHVPVVVVTRGRDGAYAIDQTTGETADVRGLVVDAIDPTGAGDVFGAAFVVGTLAGWALDDRLRFANLCAALSVQHFGGSLAAPGWGEIISWVRENVDPHRASPAHQEYGFLAELVPDGALAPVRRAGATLRLRR